MAEGSRLMAEGSMLMAEGRAEGNSSFFLALSPQPYED